MHIVEKVWRQQVRRGSMTWTLNALVAGPGEGEGAGEGDEVTEVANFVLRTRAVAAG